MEKNQKGFSVVEGLLILFIAGIISFVGWYLLHARNYDSLSSITESQNLTNEKFVVPESWVEYKFTRTGISFWAPRNWKTEELEKVNQVSIDAPNATIAKTIDWEKETFRFHINIASPSANSSEKDQKTPHIFSSSVIPTINLLEHTYLTLNSSAESTNSGVDSFIVTNEKYSSNDKSYKPALQINDTSYEVWGGIYYENDNGGSQPRLSLEQFDKLDDYLTAQEILKSIKSLK